MAIPPVCDRHPNLQMIHCSLTTAAFTDGYMCPVPGCGRHRDERGYFDVEVKPGAKNDRMNCQTVARGDHENGFSGLGGA